MKFIKNRNNQKIAVITEKNDNQKGLVFVMHGLGGFKEQKHIQTFADAFKEQGYTVVRFDTTNSLGESDGNYENATTTQYYEDLQDVIKWAENQLWYEEPFVLVGHSLGGISVALFAEEHSEKVKAVAPISSVISGKLTLSVITKEMIGEFERTGWKIAKSASKPGVIKKLKWRPHVESIMKYNLLDNADKLTMPVLLIVGEKDKGTPAKHQQLLFDILPGDKELHIIKGAPHTFKEEQHLAEIKKILTKWISIK